MAEILLQAEIRNQVGKDVKRLRREGKVPGIYYGHGMGNIPISLPLLTIKKIYLSSGVNLINLQLSDGTKRLCILREVQSDPVTDIPIHFDMQGIKEDEEITLEIPVQLTGGIPKGVREGGILQHVLHTLEISCLPKSIPDHIEIDVSALEINKAVHVKDITIPNVKILESESSTIVAVIPPTVEKEETPAVEPTEAAPAEPEVIAKGKKAEEGADSAEAAE
ncbi:MAG TPA: 50S ribosomal protein L25 [Bacteroidota bacterium]|nr:50S ribosomal protein L25 [Bacteroidota bacterium]